MIIKYYYSDFKIIPLCFKANGIFFYSATSSIISEKIQIKKFKFFMTLTKFSW